MPTDIRVAVQSTLSIEAPPPSRTPEPQEPAASQASHPLPPLPPGTPKALPAASASSGPPAASTVALAASEPAPVPQLVTGAADDSQCLTAGRHPLPSAGAAEVYENAARMPCLTLPVLRLQAQACSSSWCACCGALHAAFCLQARRCRRLYWRHPL